VLGELYGRNPETGLAALDDTLAKLGAEQQRAVYGGELPAMGPVGTFKPEAFEAYMAEAKAASEQRLVDLRAQYGVALDGSEDHLTGGLAAEAQRVDQELKEQEAAEKAERHEDDSEEDDNDDTSQQRVHYADNRQAGTMSDATTSNRQSGVAPRFENVKTPEELRALAVKLKEENAGRTDKYGKDEMSGFVGANSECVSLLKALVPGMPAASLWRKGMEMRDTDDPPIAVGTPLAMFNEQGRYPMNSDTPKHAFIFGGYGTDKGKDGYYVIEQSNGRRPEARFVPFEGQPGGNPRYVGTNYAVVEWKAGAK